MNQKSVRNLNSGISADCVIFGFDFEKLQVLLIERDSPNSSTKPEYALPGDLIYDDENLDQAAERVLLELTGLTDIFMEQLGAFGDPDRLSKDADKKWLKSIRSKPDQRVITVAYFSLVNIRSFNPRPSHFARSVVWKPLNEIKELAFDHLNILNAAKKRLKANLDLRPIGFNLLPEKFTLTQLHKLYEAILGRELDKRNFRRKMANLKIVDRLNDKQKGVPHKPSNYYMFNLENYNKLVEEGFNNFGF
jgi:8-oxo-dGTP diphosphatase